MKALRGVLWIGLLACGGPERIQSADPIVIDLPAVEVRFGDLIPDEPPDDALVCGKGSRIVQSCAGVLAPVCGWGSGAAPQTFENACLACRDRTVEVFSPGDCLEQDRSKRIRALPPVR